MKGTFSTSYVSKKGNDTFVYTVDGTPAELAKFKEVKGEYFRDNEKGQALFFTSNYVGETCDLIITTNDNVVADTSEMKKMASLVKQAGGNLGDAIATQAGASLFASLTGKRAPVASAPEAATSVAPVEEKEEAKDLTEE